MPWTIQWTDRAIRDLGRLDTSVARRVIERLEKAAADPVRVFARLTGGQDFKMRIGDYRLLAALSFETTTIIVQRVDHRSRIYKSKR